MTAFQGSLGDMGTEANRVRRNRRLTRERIQAGHQTASSAIEQPLKCLGSLRVSRFLEWAPGIGQYGASRMLLRCGLASETLMRDLAIEQRKGLVAELRAHETKRAL